MRRFLLPSLLLASLLSPGLTEAAAPAAGREARRTPLVRAVERAAPSVVNISADELQERSPFGSFGDPVLDEFFNRFFDAAPRKESRRQLGSGFVVDGEGHVLTNHHVVSRAARVVVTDRDGKEYRASLVGSDPQFDLAVLKVDGGDALRAAPLGDSDDLMIGETVVAIGNPFGLSHTITTGVVSALKRSVRVDRDTVYSDFIQTDASINPGNSGGPLVNILGEVVGINTAIYRGGEGIGFAIPVATARKVLGELLRHGRVSAGWLGLFVQNLTPALRESFRWKEPGGVLVSRAVAGKADGPRPGDILIALDGRGVESVSQVGDLAAHYLPGDTVVAEVVRDGVRLSLHLTCRRLEGEEAKKLAWDVLGLSLSRSRRGGGFTVEGVRPGSGPAKVGFSGGDLLRELNGVTLGEEEDLHKALAGLVYRERAVVALQRGRTTWRIAIPVGE